MIRRPFFLSVWCMMRGIKRKRKNEKNKTKKTKKKHRCQLSLTFQVISLELDRREFSRIWQFLRGMFCVPAPSPVRSGNSHKKSCLCYFNQCSELQHHHVRNWQFSFFFLHAPLEEFSAPTPLFLPSSTNINMGSGGSSSLLVLHENSPTIVELFLCCELRFHFWWAAPTQDITSPSPSAKFSTHTPPARRTSTVHTA